MPLDMTTGMEIVLGGIAIYYVIMFSWAYKKTRKNMDCRNK